MPSPFPGMDPYLEGDVWSSFHAQFGAEIARQLTPLVRPRYLAWPHQRYVMDAPDDFDVSIESMNPDVGVIKTKSKRKTRLEDMEFLAPIQMATVIPTPVPHVWVEIRDAKKRRLVTAIEFMSPTNKRGQGRRDYLEKRRTLLLSTTHLMEIDLLRKGRRVPMRKPLPAGDYFVFLSRAGRRPLTDVWPIRLNQPLPTVPVPLLNGDADVPLDLQRAFTNVYDISGYDVAVDYSQRPDVPLSGEMAAWAGKELRAAGFRT